jgi:hypothetical protein
LRKLLICVDGANGVGKSSLASWLAWQLGAVAIHLDLYVIPDTRPLQWRTGDLQRAIDARLRIGPVILEGVLALNALEAVKRSPDFLIFAEGSSPSLRLGPEIAAYNAQRRPRDRANFTLQGFVDRFGVGDATGIETPAEFFRQVLEPDYQAFLDAPTDLRLAFHAAASLFHLRDWVAAAKGLDKGSLQLDLEARCKSFGVIRDVANAGKHLMLTNPSTNVRGVGDVRLNEIGPSGYDVGPGGYDTPFLAYGPVMAIVVAPDGVLFARVASAVRDMWIKYLAT